MSKVTQCLYKIAHFSASHFTLLSRTEYRSHHTDQSQIMTVAGNLTGVIKLGTTPRAGGMRTTVSDTGPSM